MSRETIEKYDPLYDLLSLHVDFMYARYYKSICLNNIEKVPFDEPIIFAPNHQNALMDALAVRYASKRLQPVFLARADIFKKPLLRKILTFLNILPIYRKRDGVSSLGNNDAIFLKTIDVIKSKMPLCILPEGNHGDQHRLRPLKKGICRMSFQAEESVDFNLGIKIIPVGLDLTHYSNVRAELLVNFGEPIFVANYKEMYEENAPKAMNMLLDDLGKGMKEVMIHIEDEEYYDVIDELRYLYTEPMLAKLDEKADSKMAKFRAQKEIIAKLDDKLEDPEFKTLASEVREYKSLVDKLNFRDWLVKENRANVFELLLYFILLAVLFPLQVYAVVNTYLPYKIPQLAVKKIKDPQFLSSVKYVLGMILFPIFFLIQFFVVSSISDSWVIGSLYFISLLFSAWFALEYWILLKKYFAKFRFSLLKWKKDKNYLRLAELRESIMKRMGAFTK